MSYGGRRYGGGGYGGGLAEDVPVHDEPILAVEWSPTTDPLADPVWVNVAGRVRSWSTKRGRRRELERFPPGRATVVFDNRNRDYDSQNAAGPWFGNLKPMRRIRIRETFREATYPIFDGFVDGWALDYPGFNKDATATVTATDAFKLFTRTDLGRSVWSNLIEAENPTVWYRLDETSDSASDVDIVALNSGSSGAADDGRFEGPPDLGAEAIVVKDPGGSIGLSNSDASTGVNRLGVDTGIDVLDHTTAFAFEAWCRPKQQTVTSITLMMQKGSTDALFQVAYDASSGGQFFVRVDDAGGAVDTVFSQNPLPTFARYHVVVIFRPGDPLELWVNGVRNTGGTVTGTLNGGDSLRIGNVGPNTTDPNSADFNWTGNISNVILYRGAEVDTLTGDVIAAHYAAGTHPWQGDLPGVRAGRVLDLDDWPADQRQLDGGATTFQSAALGTSTLEHLHKTAESEFGVVFIDRAGNVRLIERDGLFNRTQQGPVLGDAAGEVGYRQIAFDEGDTLIRNRATISRLSGVTKTAVDQTSIDEFGRFQYTLDGLLHQTDAHSADYAAFVAAEYADQRRRVTTLEVGPPIAGEEDVVIPAMLGRELAELILVRFTPLGGGARFEQECSIEGIEHSGQPGGPRVTRFMLSPSFTGSF